AQRVVPFKVYAAMAAGRAVVTGDTAAARELLHRGEVVTVPPGDPVALAAALARLAADPAARGALARRGRLAYRERFSGAVLGARGVSLLTATMARHQAGRPSPWRRPIAPAALGATGPRRRQ
ncbi:MAG: glycosyltransferase, partial [Anaerolineae bacterium]